MSRHLFAAAAALLAAFGLAGCQDESASTSQPSLHWKLVSAWPKDYPGLGGAAEGFAARVKAMSGGRLSIQVYAGGELVPAPQLFDAVARGSVELGYGAASYWQDRVPAAQFFSGLPFGLSPAEMHAWLSKGGGQQLWAEVYAPFGVKPLAAGSAGMPMGGWYHQEIDTLADLQGLKIRLPGLAGAVFERLGAHTLDLAEGEAFRALQSNAIDASAGVSPFNDLASGLHKAARFYYYPGWQAPQTASELLVNQQAYAALPADLQAIVTEAARAASQDLLDDYLYNNALALDELKRQGVQFKRFPDEVLAALRQESDLVLGELAAQSALYGRIWASLKAFQAQVEPLQQLSEQELYNWR